MYHAESVQEDFLVLMGECLLIIEDQERHLRAWDFVHCPPGTAHTFVGAGRWSVRTPLRREPRPKRRDVLACLPSAPRRRLALRRERRARREFGRRGKRAMARELAHRAPGTLEELPWSSAS